MATHALEKARLATAAWHLVWLGWTVFLAVAVFALVAEPAFYGWLSPSWILGAGLLSCEYQVPWSDLPAPHLDPGIRRCDHTTMSASASPISAEASPSSLLRDSFIPTFTGQPEDYREWRRRITLYHHKMKLGKRGGESVLNIVSSLTGAAWRLLENFDVSTAKGDNTFDDIMKKLDQHFQYDDRVQLPGDFDAYFGICDTS